MAKHSFETEVNQLLQLMIHSLYSNKEIFLRELISNSSDALDKLKLKTLTEDEFKDFDYSPRVDIDIDKENNLLTVADNGIGMDEQELIQNLGTIAKSGTKSFIENLSGDAKKDSNLIGQFGVGFYSSFMVADKVEVVTKKAGEEKAYKWESDGSGEYEITETTKEHSGTAITLHLKEDASEYADTFRIESIISKYSNHVPFPIYTTKEKEVGEGEEKKTEKVEEQINKADAIWRMAKTDLSKEEYQDFYKQISHDSQDPYFWIHTHAEGTLEYHNLFYIPKTAPFDLFRVDYQPGVKLYVKRVFITDDEKELLPPYLRFVRGIIDAEDLPLNVSREILQQNIVLEKIKKAAVKKILGEMKKKLDKDREGYEAFFEQMGKALKEGLYTDYENKDKLLDLMLFKSSKREGYITLKEYKEQMKPDQETIYFLTGENESMVKNSPLLEKYIQDDIEVLLLSDEVDSVVMPMVGEYDGTKLEAINSSASDDKVEEKTEEEYKGLVASLKELLGEEVKDVKLTTRLTKSPSCVVYDKEDPDFAMQQMMAQMGQGDMANVKPILEINPDHEMIKKLKDSDKETQKDIADIILTQAKLNEGLKVNDVSSFIDKVNKFVGKAL